MMATTRAAADRPSSSGLAGCNLPAGADETPNVPGRLSAGFESGAPDPGCASPTALGQCAMIVPVVADQHSAATELRGRRPVADYGAWNAALANHFFHSSRAGRPVFLFVTAGLIAELGLQAGLPPETFETALVGPPGS